VQLPSHRHGALPVALAALAIACGGEPTAPIVDPKADQVAVSLAVVGSPSETVTESSNGVSLTCDVTLRATATGHGIAAWRDGVMRFYAGPSRLFIEDSLPLSAADVRSVWGESITAGASPESRWRFSASLPFEIEMEFRLVGQSADQVPDPAKTRFACGPKPAALGTAPPTVTELTVSPSGDLQPGDGFDVTYTATSPYALWSTALTISGPFTARRDLAERGVTSATHTVHFTVPAGAKLDMPITVAVASIDPGNRLGERTVVTSGRVVDRTPPVILGARFLGRGSPRLAGQFAVGDVATVGVTATDNNALEWLVWELGAPANMRDSVRAPIAGTSFPFYAEIRVRPEWVGSPVLSVYVRDAAGLKSQVLVSPPDSVRFYPLVSRPVTTPAVATSPGILYPNMGDLAYDAKRNMFYLALSGTNDVAVLDVATMTFKAPITLAAPAAGLDLSAGGDSLIIVLPSSRSLAMVDLARPSTPPTTIALGRLLDSAGAQFPGSLPTPGMLRVAANGKAIVMLSYRTSGGDIALEVDLATGVPKMRTDARNSSPYPFALGATPDRSRIVLLDIPCPRSYLSATDSFGSCGTPTGFFGYRGLTFDAAGRRFSVGNSAFDLDFNLLRLGGSYDYNVSSAALSSDGDYLYLGIGASIIKTRIADGVMTERFNLPVEAQRVFVSPAGDWMAVFQTNSTVRATRVDLR
jgi:hypothetical protein